jgi:hypothetical protein
MPGRVLIPMRVESATMTIREHLRRRSRVMFALAMAALLSSLVPCFIPWWPDLAAHAWWAFWMMALAAFVVVGARMRCPRCGSKINPDAGNCAGCGIDFGEQMPAARDNLGR